ncbi:MAG TPA: hypothetical protein VFX70_08965 [Mycobacteriales bacterium]|nr:hypothetical protein [Mycobacteriales bacterium]
MAVAVAVVAGAVLAALVHQWPEGGPARALSAAATPSVGPSATRSPKAWPAAPAERSTGVAPGEAADLAEFADIDPITPASRARLRAAVTASVRRAAALGITQGVLVADRHTGQTIVSIGADTPVPAVSVAKLLFAVDVLDTAGGADRLAPATLGLLYRMIATSDDALASAFYSSGGGNQIVERVAARYHLRDTGPSPEPQYWGDIRISAADMASLLAQMLADPRTGAFLGSAMLSSTAIARDGYDQEFGMNAVDGAGSKQGWGCCLGGVVSIHSIGFTADEIVAVLSTAAPDAPGLNVPEVSAFADDPGFLASVAASTATARAAIIPRPALLPVRPIRPAR